MDPILLELAQKYSARYRVFGNARRLIILWILSQGELSVNEIAAQTGSSLQNISQHLHLLKRHGIVSNRRDGQTIYYRIQDRTDLEPWLDLLKMPEDLLNMNT
jgi:DNA-binding transcriptional ArsR family regulator